MLVAGWGGGVVGRPSIIACACERAWGGCGRQLSVLHAQRGHVGLGSSSDLRAASLQARCSRIRQVTITAMQIRSEA
jgi:hypothetical protein